MRGPDGRWRKAGAVFPYPYFDEKQPENDWNQRLTDSPYTGRNYRLFAVLAGVRNDYGIEPIAEPRGVPDDVSKDVLKEYVYEVLDHEPTDDEQEARRCCSAANAERWIRNGSSHWIEKGRILSGPDWHSASWLTLRELLAYDWHRPFGDEGWVSPAQYLEWKRRGRPSAWCKSVGGGGVRHVSHEEMDRLIASKEVDPETEGPMANYYTRVEWGTSRRIRAGTSWKEPYRRCST